MVEIELPINLACKHKKNNLLNVITYRCLWKNQCNSAQISDKQCITHALSYSIRKCNLKARWNIWFKANLAKLNLGKNWIILYKTKFMTKSWNSLKSDFFKYSRFSMIRLTFSPSATPANIFFDFVDLTISIIPNFQHFSETINQIRKQFLPK